MDALADRNLLFGLLALQTGMIDQAALVVAFNTWTRDKVRSLAEILLDQKAIDADDRDALSAMAARHLKRHGDDAGKSLAAVPAPKSLRRGLAALADPDLDATLGHVAASSPTATSLDADATGIYGAPAGDGRRFRILRPHAKGGLGEVFVALDGELHREVALKQILDHHADDPTSRTRFVLEAEITGGLEHPGIVPVYGLGSHGDGRPYYAMRFIRGDSLREAIASFHSDESLKKDPGKRSLALRKLLRRFVDVCNAIGYAHGRGVIHRDLKPANVIVGRHGETLVVDWGLAKAMGKSEPSSVGDERTLMPSCSSGSAETLPGSALGTPAYMSPEQAAGDLERLGPRSDVYSLGATLYCLLTGKPPFGGTTLGEMLREVQKGQFPPPRQVDPSIDRALEAVCLMAMATDPDARHASARALADDVERWAADEPTSAWAEPLSVKARRWMRRNRSAVTAVSAAALVALVGLSAVLAVQSRANEVLTAKNLELAKANRLKDEANAQLRESNARVQARFDLAREAIRSFQDGVNEDEMLKGEELKGLRNNLLRSAAGFYEKLEQLLRGQADRASRAILARSYSELGDLTDKIGVKPEALAVHRKALAIRRDLAASPGADAGARLDLARNLLDTGLLTQAIGDGAGALSAFEEARSLSRPLATGPGATDAARSILGATYHLAANNLLATGKPAEALAEYREAIAIRRKLADDNPDAGFRGRLADSLSSLGLLQVRVGRHVEALGSLREALAIRRKLVDDDPAATAPRFSLAGSHQHIGLLLAQGGRLSEALPPFLEATAIYRKLAEDNPAVTNFRDHLADALNNVGVSREKAGQTDEALVSYLEMSAIRRKLAEDNPAVTGFRGSLAISHINIGWLASRTGQTDRAMASYREALAILRKLAEDNPADTGFRFSLASTLFNFGMLEDQTGQPDRAMTPYREALVILRKLVDDNPIVVEFRELLADVLYKIGERQDHAGQPADALESILESAAVRRKLAEDNPVGVESRRRLGYAFEHLGSLRARMGRPAEEMASYREAEAVRRKLAEDHPDVAFNQVDLATGHGTVGKSLALAGDLPGAVAEHRQAVAILGRIPPTAGNLYDLACGQSLLAGAAARPGSGVAGHEAEAMAVSAVSTLGRAIESGYRNHAHIRTDTDLDPLRSRPDFRLLMGDLAFPADPFAR